MTEPATPPRTPPLTIVTRGGAAVVFMIQGGVLPLLDRATSIPIATLAAGVATAGEIFKYEMRRRNGDTP